MFAMVGEANFSVSKQTNTSILRCRHVDNDWHRLSSTPKIFIVIFSMGLIKHGAIACRIFIEPQFITRPYYTAIPFTLWWRRILVGITSGGVAVCITNFIQVRHFHWLFFPSRHCNSLSRPLNIISQYKSP